MNKYKIIAMLICVASIGLTGCTENQRAKSFGGSMTVNAPTGQTVVNMTWKDQNLWVQYRERRKDEVPSVATFKEYSEFGMVEGTVTVIEK